jgi:alpha-L-rhamnosidase
MRRARWAVPTMQPPSHALVAEAPTAFANEYATPSGRLLSDATAADALAIQLGLLPGPAQRRHVGATRVEQAPASGYHLSTGFVGTPRIGDALCAAGHCDAAQRIPVQSCVSDNNEESYQGPAAF